MIREIVDTHCHVWNRRLHPQTWIDSATMSDIDRDFSVGELIDATASNGVNRVVIVQASNSTSETENLLDAAWADAVEAIVGWADLASPGFELELDRLRALPNGASLRGIRHLAHTEPDPAWLLREDVARGLDSLGAAGLSFDLVVRHTQLPVALAVVRAHPQVRFVLDHLGKPPIASGDLGEWSRGLRALAAERNVVAKLSGLTIEADWASWGPAQLEPVLGLALELFGAQRLMFGSDWPLVQLAGGYGAWLDAYLEWSGRLAEGEQLALDSGTARLAYGAR